MKEGIKNIIFDFGGVVFNIDESRTVNAFAQMFQCGVPDLFRKFMGANGLFERFERGELSTDDFLSTIQSVVPSAITREQIISAWNSVLIGYPEEHVQLLLKLKKKYRTFLLSNTNELHTREFIKFAENQKLPIHSNHDLFEKVWYSNEIGMRKPDPRIYEYALKDAGIKAEETMFVDDLQQNVDAASSVGIYTERITPEHGIMQIFSEWV
ncbi:MAG: HAD family phosphatase [Bacteroidales bacterium]|nr:HAD family phosphatase [Bacteroidales bacterium]